MLESLISRAIQKKMCSEYLTLLKACTSISQAFPLYLKNPTWALSEDFLPLNVIRKVKTEAKQHGIYVDYNFENELINEKQVYILHSCKGKIRVKLNLEKKIIPIFYLAHGCDVEIEIEGDIKVPIYRYD